MLTLRALTAELLGSSVLIAGILAATLTAGSQPGGAAVVALVACAGLIAAVLAFGPISGGHFNPAVTLGLVAAGRFEARHALPYVAAQVAGGIAAALFVAVIAAASGPVQGGAGGDLTGLVNTYSGRAGPGLWTAGLVEAIAAAVLIAAILAAAISPQAPSQLPLAAGLIYGLLTLVTYPVSSAALNPARATAAAVLAPSAGLGDLWLFWAAPVAGAVVGGLIGRWLASEG
ncbi:MAG: aquaporin [Hyphomicrobiaceae bacterium]|nr:aquaporin [Hyphomicrobiaceae bacterium]